MEKKLIVRLTNEKVTRKFKSSFDLVNYAIRLAENMISTGRDARVKSDMQNRAMLILEEIREGKDYLDDLKVAAPVTSSQHQPHHQTFHPNEAVQLVEEDLSIKEKKHSHAIFEGEE